MHLLARFIYKHNLKSDQKFKIEARPLISKKCGPQSKAICAEHWYIVLHDSRINTVEIEGRNIEMRPRIEGRIRRADVSLCSCVSWRGGYSVMLWADSAPQLDTASKLQSRLLRC